MYRTSDLKSKILLGLQGTTSFSLRGSYKYRISSVSPSARPFYFGTINDIYNKCVWLEAVSTAGIAICESNVNYELLNMMRIKKKFSAASNSLHLLPFKNLSCQQMSNTILAKQQNMAIEFLFGFGFYISLVPLTEQKGTMTWWLSCWLGTPKTWMLFLQFSRSL